MKSPPLLHFAWPEQGVITVIQLESSLFILNIMKALWRLNAASPTRLPRGKRDYSKDPRLLEVQRRQVTAFQISNCAKSFKIR